MAATIIANLNKEAGGKENVLIVMIPVMQVQRRCQFFTCKEKRSRCKTNIKLGSSCVFWEKKQTNKTKQPQKNPNRKTNKIPQLAVFMM